MEAKNYWFTPDPKNAPKHFGRGPHPAGFTGVRGEGKERRHYYKGRVWQGPTNMVGNAQTIADHPGVLGAYKIHTAPR